MPRVKIGVIGCGAIAQVQHMPNLSDLPDLFDVAMVCDLSPGAAEYVANKFGVPDFVTDYHDVLDSDVDAVLHCAGGYKPSAAAAAFEAGKHLFIEKPLCASPHEVDRIVAAQKAAGTVGQVGYMRIHDPAFERAKAEVDAMDAIRFVQVNHLHPNNALHLRQHDIRRFDDHVQGTRAQLREESESDTYRDDVLKAIHDAPRHVQTAFGLLSGSMIHDIYGMRVMLGVPTRVVNADIWRDGGAITYTLEYPQGHRLIATWADLADLWAFKETLDVYGDGKRVLLSYPTGFSRGILTRLIVEEIDDTGTTSRREPAIPWESCFVAELRHFHDCIANGVPCIASIESARAEIDLILDISRCCTH